MRMGNANWPMFPIYQIHQGLGWHLSVKATFFGRSGEKLAGLKGRDIQKMLEHNLTDDEIFTAVQKEAEGRTILLQGRLQLQTREIEGETMQSQTLFANRVIFPNPKALSEELISQLSNE